MNKVIAWIIVSILVLWSIGQGFASAKIKNDYAYFPWGSFANNDLYQSGGLKKVSIFSKENVFWFTLYKVLFWNDLYFYKGEYFKTDPYFQEHWKEHQKLFQAIFEREYNQYKISKKTNTSDIKILENLKRDLEKEVELSQLRYEKMSDAQKDTKEIEKRLIPVLELYFKNLDTNRGDLRFKSENICGQNLFKKIDFSMERSQFKNIKKYYLFAVNWNNSNAAPWGKDKSMSQIVVTEKDLLSLNKKMFFFQKVNVSEKKKMYKVRDWVQEKYKDLKYTPEYDKFVMKEFLDLSFQINYSDLVKYYKSVWVDYHQKMSFSLLWIDAENNVYVLSYDTGNISVELDDNIVNKEKIIQACESFTQEPQNRLMQSKVHDFFKKLDVKFWLYDVKNKQYYSKSVIIITQSEKNNLERYERLLNKLYKKVEDYKQKINKQLQWIVYGKNANILANKKKIEKLGNIFIILKGISTTISQPTDYIDYRWISNAWKLWDIKAYLIRYKEVIKDKKPWTAVLYSCEQNPEQCKSIIDYDYKHKSKFEYYPEFKTLEQKYKYDKELIVYYYWNLSKKLYKKAYKLKYKPSYSGEHLQEIYKDIARISKPSNILKIKDFYKFKVIMIDSKWVPETYLVNMKIIDWKIKTLSSRKIK